MTKHLTSAGWVTPWFQRAAVGEKKGVLSSCFFSLQAQFQTDATCYDEPSSIAHKAYEESSAGFIGDGTPTSRYSAYFNHTALYNLLDDPTETHDVSAEYPEVRGGAVGGGCSLARSLSFLSVGSSRAAPSYEDDARFRSHVFVHPCVYSHSARRKERPRVRGRTRGRSRAQPSSRPTPPHPACAREGRPMFCRGVHNKHTRPSTVATPA